MKHNSSNSIYKEVVIIGNGPSGIALSYMLAGNLPVVVSNEHPDEMLALRLKDAINDVLINHDLGHLAVGLEGRSTNPVSLLLDALVHPCADIGLEMAPLVEWKPCGKEVDHVVLGKGPPGGSWHRMDPNILTLSLGAWMALPGLPYVSRDTSEKRAFASNVAQYYKDYVEKMNLTRFFENGVTVTKVTSLKTTKANDQDNTHTWVSKVNNDKEEVVDLCTEPEVEQKKSCPLSRALNFITLRGHRKSKTNRCCKRPRENTTNDSSPDRKIRDVSDKLPNSLDCLVRYDFRQPEQRNRFMGISCDLNNFKFSCDSLCSRPREQIRSYLLRNSHSIELTDVPVPYPAKSKSNLNPICDQPFWAVEIHNPETGTHTTYLCKYLVLANGVSDLPNRLKISENKKDPSWLFHDVRTLEIELDCYVNKVDVSLDPVVVIGAGLSAADAVIAARGRNVPVVHIFRSNSTTMNKHLPENMYPEYHKVYQMMKDGGSSYPLYRALPEYTLTDFETDAKTVTLTSPTGETLKTKVSFVAVLIGSRPNLSFLPEDLHIGQKKNIPVDCKTNPIDIDKFTHRVNGAENLFAIGPLAGDNFVRFIPGGALAVVKEIYKDKEQDDQT